MQPTLRTATPSQAHFSKVPIVNSTSRNTFSIDKTHKTTHQFDGLYPLFWFYTQPGDHINGTLMIAADLTTQIQQLYDGLYYDLQAWHCPFRILQKNAARLLYNTQENPTQDNSALTTPKIDLSLLTTNRFREKTVYDYLGFPTKIDCSASTEHINNYLGRAINLTWNTKYRDQNLQNPVPFDTDDGPDDPNDYETIMPRGKRFDKFTSCLPFLQKGTPVGARLLGSGPVLSDNTNIDFANGAVTDRNLYFNSGSSTVIWGTTPGSTLPAQFGTNTGLEYSLTAGLAYMLTNDLRLSVSVQHVLENDARGGTRDVEAILNRWGVQVPDFRMDLPEYIAGATFDFDGHLVPQSSESGTTPQGTLTQFSKMRANFQINHSFLEHGVFFILGSARSNITYQQGLNKQLSYKTRFDFWQPEFANIGEVAVRSKELMFTGVDVTDNLVFGYNEYGYEMRYTDNMVTGEMRSNATNTLDSRHMADEYITPPTLNSAYIESNTPIDRNIAVASGTQDPIQLNTIFKGAATRIMPLYSIPGLTRL